MIKVNFHTSLLSFKVPAKYLHFNVQNACASNDILRCYEHFRNVTKVDNLLTAIQKCTHVPFQMISLTNSHIDTNILIVFFGISFWTFILPNCFQPYFKSSKLTFRLWVFRQRVLDPLFHTKTDWNLNQLITFIWKISYVVIIDRKLFRNHTHWLK